MITKVNKKSNTPKENREKFFCTIYKGVLKAQGSSTAGDIYAKQFSGSGDLQAVGNWYKAVNAKAGDIVRVKWVRPDEIVIEIVHR